MESMRKISAIIMGMVLLYLPMKAQVSIKGPGCVIPGIIYHYRIKAGWDSAATMQVCVQGGVIRNKDSSTLTCTASGGIPLDGVMVVWNGPGSILVTSSKGNASFTVVSTKGLRAGTIVAALQTQMLARKVVPAVIRCNPDTGGSCSPNYSYQWQQSLDRVSWGDIPGATGPALGFTAPLTVTRFYRRKVTETNSGTVAYSDVASVFVGIGDYPPDSSNMNPAP
jgi:hypothetical protein